MSRYSRHLLVPGMGIEAQRRLLAARVAVVGAGGLGSPIIAYLAAAGVGHLTIIDDDVVDATNLQRQVMHTTEGIGGRKVDSASAFATGLNPDVTVEVRHVRITPENAQELLAGHDLVLDGADNFPTRYAVSDASRALGLPVVWAAVLRFDAQLSTFVPGVEGAVGLRDLFPRPPREEDVPSCSEAGVLGALVGQVGSIMAAEAVKLICGFGEPLVGRVLLVDALSQRTREVPLRPVGAVVPPSEREHVKEHVPLEEISATDLAARLAPLYPAPLSPPGASSGGPSTPPGASSGGPDPHRERRLAVLIPTGSVVWRSGRRPDAGSGDGSRRPRRPRAGRARPRHGPGRADHPGRRGPDLGRPGRPPARGAGRRLLQEGAPRPSRRGAPRQARPPGRDRDDRRHPRLDRRGRPLAPELLSTMAATAAGRAPALPEVDLLVLAGGQGRRLGGQDKAALEIGGRTLLDRLLSGVGPTGAQPLGGLVVVVGATPVPAGVLRTLEDPPDGGPVAGIAAGLDRLDRSSSRDWVAVVAVDQPGAGAVLPVLRAQLPVLPRTVDAVSHFDPGGQRQWLLAVYRRTSLRRALDTLGGTRDTSVRRLVTDLQWALVASPDRSALGDVDTWEDVLAWEARLARTSDGRAH